MSIVVDEVLARAMELSVKERAEVAAELLASLDGEPDPEADPAWAAEIERRVRQLDADVAQSRSPGRRWVDVKADLERRRQ